MSVCLNRGARKPETIMRCANHPQYGHGQETLEDAVVEFMVKQRTTAAEYFYEYQLISLARTKLDWVTAQ